jgi:hypothetical protein
MTLGIADFRDLICAFRDAGYSFRSFDAPTPNGEVYLRHDIDFSVAMAAELAREEHDLGVVATYFLMLTSNAYNLLSNANVEYIREIMSLGHVVSLHFDPAIYDDVDAGFAREVEILSAVTGRACEIVSLHRPGVFLDDNNRRLPHARHTYEDAYFRDVAYISDSGGSFKYGHPLQHPAFASRRSIHLLLHPIWWRTGPGSPSDKIREWQARSFSFLNEEARANCLTFDGRSVCSA